MTAIASRSDSSPISSPKALFASPIFRDTLEAAHLMITLEGSFDKIIINLS